MSSLPYKLSIVVGTILAGSLNSLFTKFQDKQCVRNCQASDLSKHVYFEQPGIQTIQMFVGEFSMILVFYIIFVSPLLAGKRKGYQPVDQTQDHSMSFHNTWLMSIPAICDICATTLMNVALAYTPVSIYQMTRGAIVLSVALLSVLVLKRRITKLEWISLATVTLGICIVGWSGSHNSKDSNSKEDPAKVVFGIGLLIAAVMLQACQFVCEEYILAARPVVPLKLVFVEGFYGLSITIGLLVVLSFILGAWENPEQFADSPFNFSQSLIDTFASKNVLAASVLIMVSIACFNFCGISLTQEFSATARSTIDTCRTLLVWICALVLGWEKFSFLQLFGFVVLVFGTLCFNGVLRPEEWTWIPQSLKLPQTERLIDVVDEPIERM